MEAKHDRNSDHVTDLVAMRVVLTPRGKDGEGEIDVRDFPHDANGGDDDLEDRADTDVWLCYHVLGFIQHLLGYQPVPTRVKDSFSFLKPNGYQSLHTALMRGGQSVEVQIRSK
ncbi:hypothetical protein ACHAWF_000567 [Thalassiosira exigua]